MKKYAYKQFQKIILPLQKFGSGAYYRMWNLAKRFEGSHAKKEKKK